MATRDKKVSLDVSHQALDKGEQVRFLQSEISDFSAKFNVSATSSPKAYILARAEYQRFHSTSRLARSEYPDLYEGAETYEVGNEFQTYVDNQAPNAKANYEKYYANPSVFLPETRYGEHHLTFAVCDYGDSHKWNSGVDYNVIRTLWTSRRTSPVEGNEKDSIINFYHALKESGWNYSFRDIIRFHTSVRCEPLTILGGEPGAGKSALARMYASYFGIQNKSFLRIDVQPSWHDRMDFLGFVKTHGDKPEFIEAETGLAEFLTLAKNAQKTHQQNGLWLACLEEINLAQPEHYFADFLQRLSIDDYTRETIPIEFRYKSNPNEYIPIESFTICPSVRFVGTCNFDETTQNFSARFLDRCNYIELQSPSLEETFYPTRNTSLTQLVDFNNGSKSKWEWKPWTNYSRQRLDDKESDVKGLMVRCKEYLEKLHILPSPRIVSAIARYVEARIDTIDEEKSEDGYEGDVFLRAFDEAFAQRILPKLYSSQGCPPGTNYSSILEKLKNVLYLGEAELRISTLFLQSRINEYCNQLI